MKYTILSGFDSNIKRLFLKLPSKLYNKKMNPQDIKLEKQILDKKHILSTYFDILPFIIVDEKNRIISRCILTYYPNDDNAYVGFFESFYDIEASSLLLKAVTEKAKKDGKNKLIGPLDASFWIKYRFKTNNFETIYTAEPYCKEYYTSFWEKFGFSISDTYFSNKFYIPKKDDDSMRCRKRLEMIKEKNYYIKKLTNKNFNESLEDIYNLIMKCYSKFPLYKKIEKQHFIEMFKNLKYVLEFDMVKLVYKNEELAGFFIAIPNYYNLTNKKISLLSLVKILKIKNNPKEYVLLYMGIGKTHQGLGSAMAEMMKQELVERKCKAIGALMHEGKVTNNYYKEKTSDRYKYVLLEKKIL